jgi:hypothetical protein
VNKAHIALAIIAMLIGVGILLAVAGGIMKAFFP